MTLHHWIKLYESQDSPLARVASFNKIVATILGILIIGNSLATAQITHPFESIFSTTARGNIVYVSNAIITCSTIPGDTGAAQCPNAQNGANRSNNQHKMAHIDIDGDGSTFNSSSANFTLPAGASVLFAGLFWGADSNHGQRDHVRFKAGGGAYSTRTADIIYNRNASYHAFNDVTSIVSEQTAGTTLSYTIANVRAWRGTGRYGGWTLVVVISDNTQVPRNMTVFNGYARVRSGAPNNNIPITVSGFLTPPAGAFSTEVGVIAYEGDLPYSGDMFKVNGNLLSDAVNPNNNFFNSVISHLGTHVTTKNPNYQNQLGYDSKIVDVPYVDPPVIDNGVTSANLAFETNGDWYYPGVITFSVEVFQPVLGDEFIKTATDVNGGDLLPGEVIRYDISVTNTGNDPATNTVISDIIPANTSYVAGSLEVVEDPNAANIGVKTDADDGDTAEFSGGSVVFRVGNGASDSNGGILPQGETIHITFSVRVDTDISIESISNQATIVFRGETTNKLYNDISGNPTPPGNQDPTISSVRLPTITIMKTLLGSSQTFDFTSADSDLDAISLTPAANSSASSSTYSKAAGSYQITEDALVNWQLTAFSCTGDDDNGSSVDLAAQTATIDLDPSEDIICTFTNTELGKIIIEKVTSPSGLPDSFSFTPSYAANFNLSDGGSNDSGYILPNSYTVVENIGLSWELTGLTCVDPDGGSSTDLATATATIDLDSGETITCTFTNDPLPDITVTKTASPTHVPETGGDVTYTIQVSNNQAEGITLDTLNDDVFGDLNGHGTCVTVTNIAASGSYSCNFTESLSGNVGTNHTNTVTAHASDDDANTTSDSDSAIVTFDDVLPNITVNKTSAESSVDEPGGTVTYNFEVVNNTAEAIILQSFDDDKFGDLDGQGSCSTPQNIAGNASYSCSSTQSISGNLGEIHTNTVTADVEDDEANTILASDSLSIPFHGIQLTKTACNTTSTDCTNPANFVISVIANPGDIIEYKIVYTRIGSYASSLNLTDTIPVGTTISDSSYAGNTEVELICPDATAVYLERSGSLAIAIDLAAECTLSTVVISGTPTEVLLDTEHGRFNFRVLVP